MSKSLNRVRDALLRAGERDTIVETGPAHTALDAANELGCEVDQIAKSIIFAGRESGRAVLFVTAGGNRVDPARAAIHAGEPLGKATADMVRAQTGFAIGGVSPLGHVTPTTAFMDQGLMRFDRVWAAAGTPRHVFALPPARLLTLSGARLCDFTA